MVSVNACLVSGGLEVLEICGFCVESGNLLLQRRLLRSPLPHHRLHSMVADTETVLDL